MKLAVRSSGRSPHLRPSAVARGLLILGVLLAPILFVATAGAAAVQPGFDQLPIGTVLGGTTRAWGIGIGDFTGDGYADVVAGNTQGDITLFRGHGNRTFDRDPLVVIDDAWNNAYGLTTGDFNGDGNLDIALGASADGATDGMVYLYRGNGNGTFQDSGASALGLVVGDAGADAITLASADVDGDMDLDIVAGDVVGPAPDATATVTLFRNGGELVPTWSATTVLEAPNTIVNDAPRPYYAPLGASSLQAYGLALGDADSDGDPDLFVVDRAGYLYVYLNDGAGAFSIVRYDHIATRAYAYARIQADAVPERIGLAAGDLNGDGLCDLAAGGTESTWNGKVHVFVNEGVDASSKPHFTDTGIAGSAGTGARGLAIGQLDAAPEPYVDVVFGTYEGNAFGLYGDMADTDGDGIMDRYDNLDLIPNYPTIDLNGDGVINRFDQIDLDGDGVGSVWDDATGNLLGDPDADGDLVLNHDDNLPMVPNAVQLDRDGDGVGEIDGPWPLCTLGDPLDNRDPDLDGIPNGPFDPTLEARYKEAKRKLMTGDTPIMLRIDALGRWWQAEFTQTLADSIYMDPTTFATEYPKDWTNPYGGDIPGHGGHGPGPGPGLEGGKELPVTLMLIPKMLWTDSSVVAYLSDRLARSGFELGQHGTYHASIEPPGQPDSEMNGYNPLEMYVYMRVGQDTMLGNYARPDGSDYIDEKGSTTKIAWTSTWAPLFTFAPPYDEFDRSGAWATALLGYGAFTSDIWVEGEPRTLMPDNSDTFDEFGGFHAAAMFMPYGAVDEIPWWYFPPDYASYEEYILDSLKPGEANCILIEEVNFSGKDAGGAVNNTVDPARWANFQTMLDIVKDFPGGVPMTVGEYAMARAYDNAPDYYNPDQADVNHDGIGDAGQIPSVVSHSYTTNEDTALSVAAPGVLAGAFDPDGGGLEAVLVDSPLHGSLTLNTDGSFEYVPDTDYYGPDEFTYKAWGGEFHSDVATASITVGWVNDPPMLTVTPAEQTVQYSDDTQEVLAEFGDDGPHYSFATYTPFPANVVGLWAMSNVHTDPITGYDVGGGRAAFGGLMDEPAGDYPVTFTMDDTLLQTQKTTTYHVLAEDATVLSAVSPISVNVSSGGTANFQVPGSIEQADDGYPGDITRAVVYVKLVPVGAGSTIIRSANAASDGSFVVSFTGVPANCYQMFTYVGGGYFASPEDAVEDQITVIDPSLGASGGGWFYWPGTDDKTTFGFVTHYGKNGTNFRGSLLIIRHTDEGLYRLKSNALTSLLIGSTIDAEGPVGWTLFSGKATYREPGWPEPIGSYNFTMYAEDRNEPGSGTDRFWIMTTDKAGVVTLPLSMAEPHKSNVVSISGGNIAIPHKAGKK